MSLLPEELAQFRSESGLSQKDLANLLNDVTGMHYSGSTISAWERGHKNIPSHMEGIIQSMIGGDSPPQAFTGNGAAATETPTDPPVGSRRPDSAPQPPDDFRVLPVPVPGGSALESVATEMFLGIGQTLEMIGAFTGGPKVIQVDGGANISLLELDGRTIAADAETLGKAWAHLASQNAWVARILTSLTSGGAWVEVIMATSGTVVKVYKNHAGYNQWLAEQSRLPDPVTEPAEDAPVL